MNTVTDTNTIDGRYVMVEIKPDTSLYSDLPSKLRAMALIAEGFQKGEAVEALQNGEWVTAKFPSWVHSHDYRLKPKPRELFAVFEGQIGRCDYVEALESEVHAIQTAERYNNGRVIRFVEAPK